MKRDVENAADAAQPGDAAEDASLLGAMNAVARKKKKPGPRRVKQLGTRPSALGQAINGASTSTSRVGY